MESLALSKEAGEASIILSNKTLGSSLYLTELRNDEIDMDHSLTIVIFIGGS